MALKNPSVKLTTSIQTFDPEQGAQVLPDTNQLTFTAEKRIEQQLYEVPASGSITITASDEGLTDADLVKVEIVTPNKPADIVINGAATPFQIKPVVSTGQALLIMTGGFTTLTVQNPDAGVAICFVISAFKKQS